MDQHPKVWSVERDERLQDCRVFSVHRSVRRSPLDSSLHDFFLIDSPEWVNIVPITPDGQVVCIRQFRHGTRTITLEIPGGLVDPGEEPARSAVRECLEETGYQVDAVESLGILSPNPALFPNQLHTFMAKGAVKVADIANTSSEHTTVELVPVDQLASHLLRGEIDHALVVATLWRFLYLWQQRSCG